MKPAGAYGGNRFNYRIEDTRQDARRRDNLATFLEKKEIWRFFSLGMLIYWGKYVLLDKKKAPA